MPFFIPHLDVQLGCRIPGQGCRRRRLRRDAGIMAWHEVSQISNALGAYHSSQHPAIAAPGRELRRSEGSDRSEFVSISDMCSRFGIVEWGVVSSYLTPKRPVVVAGNHVRNGNLVVGLATCSCPRIKSLIPLLSCMPSPENLALQETKIVLREGGKLRSVF